MSVPLPVRRQVERFASGAASVAAAVGDLHDRIEAADPVLHAFMATDRDAALRRAAQLDRELAGGRPPGPLHGIAVAVKDCIDVAGWISTSGSIVRADHRAERSAACIQALESAGAVVIGKTMMDEWAFGGSTENPHFGTTGNPWDPTRSTGGSSGGSAAAVAAGLAPLALGTDTGGSVRLPAGVTGVVGYKPTLGRVPTDGIHPLADTYDTLGWLSLYADDALLVLEVLDGRGAPGASAPAAGLAGLRVLHLAELPHMEPAVAAAYESALGQLRDVGAEVEPVAIPWLWDVPAHFRPVVLTELARLHSGPRAADRVRYGAPLQQSIALGEQIPAEEYARALAFRDRVRAEFGELMSAERPTVLVSPMTARVADPHGMSFEDVITWPDGTQEDYFTVATRFTLFANVLGAPAVSVPLPVEPGQLPVGFQLVSLPGTDHELLRAAAELQERLGGPPASPFLERWEAEGDEKRTD